MRHPPPNFPDRLQTPHQTWLSKLATLNIARTEARGAAPHKPLMLLTVIDLIESGDIPDGWVKYDVRLVSRFRDYWELVLERQRNQPDIPMPFHALGGDKDQVWETFTADGQPSKAKATTRLCSLDPELFACLQDSAFRRKARETLVSIYFTPREQVMLCARLGLPVPNTADIEAMKLDADEFKARQKKAATAASRATCSAATISPAPSPATGSTRKPLPSSRPPTSTSTPSPATTIRATASPSRPMRTGCSTPGFGRSFQKAMTC